MEERLSLQQACNEEESMQMEQYPGRDAGRHHRAIRLYYTGKLTRTPTNFSRQSRMSAYKILFYKALGGYGDSKSKSKIHGFLLIMVDISEQKEVE